jgi:hypothetical protein
MPEAHNGVGIALAQIGEPAAGEAEFREAVRVRRIAVKRTETSRTCWHGSGNSPRRRTNSTRLCIWAPRMLQPA